LASAAKIAIIAALRREIDELVSGQPVQMRYLQGVRSLTYVVGRVSFTCAGIGCGAATRAADALIQELQPELIVSVGFAGAVDPALDIGSIVTPSIVIDNRSGQTFSTARGKGVLVSAVRMADAAEKVLLRQRYGALAVDMEAAGVAERAHYHGIPFLAVKSVSDTAHTTLPDFTRFVREDGSFATTSFLFYLIFHPTLWPAVRRLAADSATAARNLATSLGEFLADTSHAGSTSGQVINSR
jgi:adenosylhomocysteine nucleosidase